MPETLEFPEKNMYDAYGILMLENKHKAVRRLKKEHEPSVHGHKTWNASFLLMDYLLYHPMPKRSRVLELGCGWGPAGVFCARQFKARVTGVDIDKDVFPYMALLAETNGVELTPKVSGFENLTKRELAEFDVIIGSDICFWDSLVDTLEKLVNRALKAGVKRVVLTDPGRPTFDELCRRVGKRHEVRRYDWYATDPEYFEGEVAEFRSV
jgi:predicted nicotinamide N-methyase